MDNAQSETLPYLSTEERLAAYQLIVDGCTHIWSKGKLQQDKALTALQTLIPLTQRDPLFLAHLTAYVMRNMKTSKDLQVFVTYANALNSGDGTPFSPGSDLKKPDLRYISAASLHNMDVKVAGMLLELAKTSYSIDQVMNQGQHFPESLRTAFKKYLRYREQNLPYVEGIKRAGLGKKFVEMYKKIQTKPTDEVASILRWKQRGKEIEFKSPLSEEFTKMSDLQIAEKIRKDKIPVMGVLGNLPRKISPVIAVALLEQATGNQAVIFRRLFEEAGVLADKEVMALYESKIKTAKTALDRVDAVSDGASEAVKKVLKDARAEVRQSQTRGLGKIYMAIDISGSMNAALEFAKDRGSIFAECVNDPANNFAWGTFHGKGTKLALPERFTSDGFKARLFGVISNGSTDCFSLYPTAREFGAEIDVFISDQGHTDGNLTAKIRKFHEDNPNVAKPKVCVIVDFTDAWGRHHDLIKQAYEANGIAVTVLKPDTLKESALVVQSVKQALTGPQAIIEQIMETELPKLPEYYFSV